MAPRFPLAAIASLTDSELYHNAYYCQLRQQCTHLLEVLRTVLRQRRDLVPSLIHSPVANSDIIVPSVYQSTLPRSASSHTSSLGPSDSASKQGSLDYAVWLWQAVEKLLESVEQPAIRPQFLPKSVLWDYEDCNDPAQGVIAAEANECRPKMNLAIRRNDGTRISNREYVNIRRAADIICTQLLNHIKSDPSSAVLLANNPRPMVTLRKAFSVEYHQAILELEAEHKILRLCSAHWKADAVIGQTLLRRINMEAKAAKNRTGPSLKPHPSNVNDSQSSDPFATSIPQVSAANAAKLAFELSPTTPTSYRDVAMSSVSPQARGLKITFKRRAPIYDILAATQTSKAPTGSNYTTHQQHAIGTEPTQEPSAGLDKGDTRADALSLRLLQVPELQALFCDIKPGALKPKRKDDLIAATINSPEFAHVSQLTVQGIVEKRKLKKGPPKRWAASK